MTGGAVLDRREGQGDRKSRCDFRQRGRTGNRTVGEVLDRGGGQGTGQEVWFEIEGEERRHDRR
jgi:hypothetical protein